VRSSGVKSKVARAATELFAAHGVDGASIGDIAALAGVSQGALYRHYQSKEDLAWSLFSEAYLRTGAELDAIRAGERDFRGRLSAMVAQFCHLYDRDPALFRFMLIAQHGFLPRIDADRRTPVDVLADTVADGVRAGQTPPVEPLAAAAVILGVVLQTAVFHIYGTLPEPLATRAAGLARAACAAVAALAVEKAW
jgi:AcrR family transcriptional regulator